MVRHMLAAEVLKLRRRRGPMLTALCLSVGMAACYLAAVGVRNDGEIDAVRSLSSGSTLLALYFGAFASILVGTEAGTADRATGVFADLVATGRSRAALVLIRIPAAIAVALVLALGGYLVAVAAAYAFQGTGPAPGAADVVRFGAWLAVATAVTTCIATSVGSLSGSRSTTLAVVLGIHTVLSNLLYGAQSLGSMRNGLLVVAVSHLRPGPQFGSASLPGSGSALPALQLPMSTATAVLVMLAWVAVPTVGAVRRERSRDVT